MLKDIINRNVKGLFIDEFKMTHDESHDFIKRIEKHVEYLWIVPYSVPVFPIKKILQRKYDFHFLELSKNFRNSREIVQEAMTATTLFRTSSIKHNIAMTLENSPTGCNPIRVDTLEEGVKESRKITKKGILVIDDSGKIDFTILNNMNERWGVWKKHESSFMENENPYQYLLDGNILIVDFWKYVGFEWPIVIIFKDCFHIQECNAIVRCTANLIIVNRRNPRAVGSGNSPCSNPDPPCNLM